MKRLLYDSTALSLLFRNFFIIPFIFLLNAFHLYSENDYLMQKDSLWLTASG